MILILSNGIDDAVSNKDGRLINNNFRLKMSISMLRIYYRIHSTHNRPHWNNYDHKPDFRRNGLCSSTEISSRYVYFSVTQL